MVQKLEETSKGLVGSTGIFTGGGLALVWGLLTVVSIFFAFKCAGQASTGEVIGGILMALVLGPLYWVYYFMTGYCKGGGR